MSTIPRETLRLLSPRQRLALIGDIMETFDDDPSAMPVPAWHKRIVEERRAAHRKDPSSAITLAELRRWIRGKRQSLQARRAKRAR